MAQAWLELSRRSVDVGGLRSFCRPQARASRLWSQQVCVTRGTPSNRAPHAAKARCINGRRPHTTSTIPACPSIRPRLILLGAVAPTVSFNQLEIQRPKPVVALRRAPQICGLAKVYGVTALSMSGAIC